jgi:hypothetical protein
MCIRDPGWKKFGSEIHPESGTLPLWYLPVCFIYQYFWGLTSYGNALQLFESKIETELDRFYLILTIIC